MNCYKITLNVIINDEFISQGVSVLLKNNSIIKLFLFFHYSCSVANIWGNVAVWEMFSSPKYVLITDKYKI